MNMCFKESKLELFLYFLHVILLRKHFVKIESPGPPPPPLYTTSDAVHEFELFIPL